MLRKNLTEREITKVYRVISGSISENIYNVLRSRGLCSDETCRSGVIRCARMGAVYLLSAVWLNSGYDHRSVEDGRKTILKAIAGEEGVAEYEVSGEYSEFAHETAAEMIRRNVPDIRGKAYVVSDMVLMNAVSMCLGGAESDRSVLKDAGQIELMTDQIDTALRPLIELYADDIDAIDDAENSDETIAFFCRNRSGKLTEKMTAGSGYPAGRREVYIDAVSEYMKDVTGDVYNLILGIHPESKDRFREALKDPQRCGFDIRAGNLYRAGELYALYYYATEHEAADPYVCASLNSVQQEIINKAAQVLRDCL